MTAKRRNGAPETPDTVTNFVSLLQSPAAGSLVAGQRVALEAARFWARRMHAYADQMAALAACSSIDEVASTQTRFIERMREDYAAESEALGALVSTAAPTPPPRRAKRSNGRRAASAD